VAPFINLCHHSRANSSESRGHGRRDPHVTIVSQPWLMTLRRSVATENKSVRYSMTLRNAIPSTNQQYHIIRRVEASLIISAAMWIYGIISPVLLTSSGRQNNKSPRSERPIVWQLRQALAWTHQLTSSESNQFFWEAQAESVKLVWRRSCIGMCRIPVGRYYRPVIALPVSTGTGRY